jgi:hypothetical protein
MAHNLAPASSLERENKDESNVQQLDQAKSDATAAMFALELINESNPRQAHFKVEPMTYFSENKKLRANGTR